MSNPSLHSKEAKQQHEQKRQFAVDQKFAHTSSEHDETSIPEDNVKKNVELSKGSILYVSLVAVALSLFLAALDVMIVSTIIEEVAKQLGSYSEIGWLFTGYSLPNALLVLILSLIHI